MKRIHVEGPHQSPGLEKLRKIALRKGETLVTLSQRIGMSHGGLSIILRGVKPVTPAIALRIERNLGIKALSFFPDNGQEQ